MIPFNKATVTPLEEKYLVDALRNSKLSGDGKYTMKVYEELRQRFGYENVLLTTSGTTALEMTALLIDLEPGDEVIVPSFTFSSTVNAFMLRGAVPVFCDIREDTFNIDENLIEGLITPKTKAIYCVDYAGVPCEIDVINEIADRHGLYVIEDAAQSIGSTYKGKFTGNLAEFSCFSFHETKNYVMGEGGAIVFNDEKYLDRAEIIREKGTNRRQVLKGLVDKYTWYDIGSSFLPSDLLAAVLYAQLERYDEIMEKRVSIWNAYHEGFAPLEEMGLLRRARVPENVTHNGHMYNIVLPSDMVRSGLIDHLKSKGIMAYICYVPLHSSPMGLKLGYKPSSCPVTEDMGLRVLRMPLYYDMSEEDVALVIRETSGYLTGQVK
ncbi:dTDP-4-amino-4,6-dideoxygalactose transaminase [Ruminococcaceae bacterium YRB3002]|nr:dTDP-4-amino-4,6-dideoxygalactose transaminase [Ruminococcaceae bacterium YRB3002]